jgi:N-acetylmuramoyl-L-alanine amidase
MNIQDRLLTINEYSRPGKKLIAVQALVMHWTGNPMASAMENRDFFENRKTGMSGFGSAHYIIGLQGEIIRCIPDNEQAYHVGSSLPDPVSKKIYTDEARRRFGQFACNPKTNSPNWVTIGIEMCPVDSEGNFNNETIASATELVSCLLEKNNLTTDDITTHHAVVGWKDCPRLWVNHPEKFEAFRRMINI